MEMSPSWSRARDWKSRNRQKRFESSNLSISARKPVSLERFTGFYFAFRERYAYGWDWNGIVTENTAALKRYLLYAASFSFSWYSGAKKNRALYVNKAKKSPPALYTGGLPITLRRQSIEQSKESSIIWSCRSWSGRSQHNAQRQQPSADRWRCSTCRR